MDNQNTYASISNHQPRRVALYRTLLGLTCVAVMSTAGSLPSRAQNPSYGAYLRQSEAINRNADAASNAAIASIQRGINREQKSIDANLLTYVRQNFARLRHQYYTSGAYRSMGFKQFANTELLSHATITPNNGAFAAGQAAHQAQVDNFNRRQAAAKTRSDAGEMLIQNNQRNSDTQLATVERSTQGSIRGNSAYVNPQTGNAQWMPTYSPGSRQAADGTQYYQDTNGRYYQQQGSSWVAVQPAGR